MAATDASTIPRRWRCYLMDQEPDMEVVSQAGSVAEGGLDAALVDVPLPDEGAAEFVRELHEANPSVPVLILTHLGDREVY